MPPETTPEGVMPSLLDRLSAGAHEDQPELWFSMNEMVATVQRDLENLLNSHDLSVGLCPECPEAQRSLITYGLPDLGSFVARTAHQRQEIGLVLENAIRLFEPRLRDVRAELLKPEDDVDRTVRFRIVARLWVDPAPEVAFDTVLELASGHYSVRSSSS